MKSIYLWTRDLHLYVGLFISPFILLFAISTLYLNHGWRAPSAAEAGTTALPGPVPIQIPEGMGTIDQAKGILRQLNLSGEIEFIRHLAKEERLKIPIMKPGEQTEIDVDLRGKTATLTRRGQGLPGALIYLHRMPGPHLAKFRGNWAPMRLWRMLTDASVYGVLFLTLSGLYLWLLMKAERKTGLVLLAAGVFSLVFLVLALTGAGGLG